MEGKRCSDNLVLKNFRGVSLEPRLDQPLARECRASPYTLPLKKSELVASEFPHQFLTRAVSRRMNKSCQSESGMLKVGPLDGSSAIR